MLNHEPHETHERSRGVGAFVACVGSPSDPRLRRALGALPQGWPSSEPTLQASLRRRLRLGHDPTAQANAVSAVSKAARDGGPNGTVPRRPSRTPVGKQGSVEQACLQNRDLRSSPGRRSLADGRDSVRVRRCWNGNRTPATAAARSWVSCGSWLPYSLYSLWFRLRAKPEAGLRIQCRDRHKGA